MKEEKPLFIGCAAALPTPFKKGRKENTVVDYDALGRMLLRQVDAGNAVVLCGTTGESPAVTEKERKELLRFAVKEIGGKVKIIFGCGSNLTEAAVKQTVQAEEAGADGALIVTPYYNKATGEGLYRHYAAVSERTSLPLLFYHVPSRTGLTVDAATLERIASLPRVVACKEACPDMSRAAECMALCGGALDFYCGCDELTLPMLSLGAKGVISVSANLFPKRVAALCTAFFEGNTEAARAAHEWLLPVSRALMREVNPIPVKWALSEAGICEPIWRAPLCEPSDACKAYLGALLAEKSDFS